MKVAIVEDNEEYLRTLEGYIERFKEENGEKIKVVKFSDGIDIVSEYTADYDVVFLDVVMKHMDGMRTAEYIRKMDRNVIIVFITGHPQYAVEGYSVEAYSYLLKPVSYFAFSQVFASCVNKIKSSRARYMVFPTDRGMDKINIDNIIYVESQGHKMVVHTDDKLYYMYQTVYGLEAVLPQGKFSRCNHCYIVNLTRIKGIHGEFIEVDGAELKISRARRKQFMEDMTNYLANEG